MRQGDYIKKYIQDDVYNKMRIMCKTNIKSDMDTDFMTNASSLEKALKRFVIFNFKNIYIKNISYERRKESLLSLLIDFPLFCIDIEFGYDIDIDYSDEINKDGVIKLYYNDNSLYDKTFIMSNVLDCVYKTDFFKYYIDKKGTTEEEVNLRILEECFNYAKLVYGV